MSVGIRRSNEDTSHVDEAKRVRVCQAVFNGEVKVNKHPHLSEGVQWVNKQHVMLPRWD
jgi:hypothetical protein